MAVVTTNKTPSQNGVASYRCDKLGFIKGADQKWFVFASAKEKHLLRIHQRMSRYVNEWYRKRE